MIVAMSVEFAIFDLDGVLADVRHRLRFVEHNPKDWDAFFDAAVDDPLLTEGAEAVAEETELGRRIVYVTGRPERCRQDTESWLARNGLPQGRILMRRDDDRRPARLVKPELVRRLQRNGTVAVMYDDDPAVVSALSGFDLDVVHARWMDAAAPAQDSLFDAQEREGRT
jgi:phosphoglycolate phosphatase-like HAD superfamily hydrolase